MSPMGNEESTLSNRFFWDMQKGKWRRNNWNIWFSVLMVSSFKSKEAFGNT